MYRHFRSPRLLLPLAVASALLLASAPRAYAQTGTATLTYDYNGDTDPTNAPDTTPPATGPSGGDIETTIATQNYIAPGGVRPGASLIGTIQDDPRIITTVTVFNRTDIAPQFDLGNRQTFSNMLFTLIPENPTFRFSNAEIVGGFFNQIRLLDDRNFLVFRDDNQVLAPGPNSAFTVRYWLLAPTANDTTEKYEVRLTPNATVPEPSVVLLLAVGGLMLGGRALTLRRRAG